VPTQPAPSQTAPDRRAREVREGNWCYLIAKWICRAFFVLVFWTKRYDPRNVPAAGAVIIASNHQSYFDPVIVGSCNRRIMQYMARDTLFRNRMFGRLIRTFNAFPVKRGATDVTAIKHSLRLLREGKALLLFPEGTRTADGRIGPAQPGVVALARRSRAPIVPVAVDGVYEAWPRGQRLPRWARFHVAYGEPLDAQVFASSMTNRRRTCSPGPCATCITRCGSVRAVRPSSMLTRKSPVCRRREPSRERTTECNHETTDSRRQTDRY
jgi:1-acyl-sn-glycerol-3-phosphate acyltransferase